MNLIPIIETSNQQFLETYAAPGRIGLVGGDNWIERAIQRAERHLNEDKKWSLFSHAFLFQGVRADGHSWVIESDLDAHGRNVRLGVQENRISKYFDERMFPVIAVLDLDLTPAQVKTVISEGLELVAMGVEYSMRELIGAGVSLLRTKNRSKKNCMAKDDSMYCSGLVQHVFLKAGIDLIPGVHPSRGTPEEVSRTPVPHVGYLLKRPGMPI